ncbi:IST1 homolog [Pseudophryne corroboree]|uniref:IST1 homolog n=1 Tax=Pseudophryne corroboree TaxID=495146 RepID=UPI0030814284
MSETSFEPQHFTSSLKEAMQQLELLKQRKSEMAKKGKKEIAEHLTSKEKVQAQIRGEATIREENLVDAIEIIQTLCDLLYNKVEAIQSMTCRDLDPTLSEAVSTVIWAAPHMETEVPELKTAASQLCHNFSKEYGNLCRSNKLGTVNDKVIQSLGTKPLSKSLVERYLSDIAKEFNVEYEPDEIMVDASPRFDGIGFNPFEAGAGSSNQDSPVCPYPQNNGAFPDAEEIFRGIDSASPRWPFPITYEIPGSNLVRSDNGDFSTPNMGIGFKSDLWSHNQDPEISDTQPGSDTDQLTEKMLKSHCHDK